MVEKLGGSFQSFSVSRYNVILASLHGGKQELWLRQTHSLPIISCALSISNRIRYSFLLNGELASLRT
jgi:hypothetical protein